MTSRDKILNAIAANQPELVALPTVDLDSVIHYDDNYTQFKTVLESIGGKVELIPNISIVNNLLIAEKANGKLIINTLDETDKQIIALTSLELEVLEKVCIKGSLGVAENGAVWVYESQMINRLLPFICQHLILVIEKSDIVPTMHHAYQKIDIAKEGFGVFIAGPSKTADIEQSLVIGAHGARTATIYVVE
ncbi:LUD domain-containing protein [Flavobacterium sp.]|uniref:LutC/YkgG family protein n=1 Tax=Flavobacterium sp. TaxID=239 RepID=UPI00286E3813|nr:LUD domain-containing protein [Flavobacterium sp.]